MLPLLPCAAIDVGQHFAGRELATGRAHADKKCFVTSTVEKYRVGRRLALNGKSGFTIDLDDTAANMWGDLGAEVIAD